MNEEDSLKRALIVTALLNEKNFEELPLFLQVYYCDASWIAVTSWETNLRKTLLNIMSHKRTTYTYWNLAAVILTRTDGATESEKIMQDTARVILTLYR